MLSPLSRFSACESSFEITVFSLNGIPRALSMDRAETQGAQFSPVYSVTGY